MMSEQKVAWLPHSHVLAPLTLPASMEDGLSLVALHRKLSNMVLQMSDDGEEDGVGVADVDDAAVVGWGEGDGVGEAFEHEALETPVKGKTMLDMLGPMRSLPVPRDAKVDQNSTRMLPLLMSLVAPPMVDVNVSYCPKRASGVINGDVHL